MAAWLCCFWLMDLSVSVSDELSEAWHARTSLSPAVTWQPRLLLVAPVISDCPPCMELEIKRWWCATLSTQQWWVEGENKEIFLSFTSAEVITVPINSGDADVSPYSYLGIKVNLREEKRTDKCFPGWQIGDGGVSPRLVRDVDLLVPSLVGAVRWSRGNFITYRMLRLCL